jgi:hypothetical protein
LGGNRFSFAGSPQEKKYRSSHGFHIVSSTRN